MASFAQALQPADTQALRAFIVARAHEIKNAPPAPGLGGGPPENAHVEPGK